MNWNCIKYSGLWYFNQTCYDWNFRKFMKLNHRDDIFVPGDRDGELDYIMRISIT